MPLGKELRDEKLSAPHNKGNISQHTLGIFGRLLAILSPQEVQEEVRSIPRII